MEIKVIGWGHYDDTEFYDSAPLTDEVIEAVVKEIKENGYNFGGDAHQEFPGCAPILNTFQMVRCSTRSWGGIMAKAWMEDEKTPMSYSLWMMDNLLINQVYPNEGFKKDYPEHPRIHVDFITAKSFEILSEKGKVAILYPYWYKLENVEINDIVIMYSNELGDRERAIVTRREDFNSFEELKKSEIFKYTEFYGLSDEDITKLSNEEVCYDISGKIYIMEYVKKSTIISIENNKYVKEG